MELYLHREFSTQYKYLVEKYGEVSRDLFDSISIYKSTYKKESD